MRLRSYKFVKNDKNGQGQWNYGKWKTYCKECGNTRRNGKDEDNLWQKKNLQRMRKKDESRLLH